LVDDGAGHRPVGGGDSGNRRSHERDSTGGDEEMTKHIGIVACSAEGAALAYRTICVGGAALMGPHDHPEVSMHTHSLARYVQCLDRQDWAGVGELMLSS